MVLIFIRKDIILPYELQVFHGLMVNWMMIAGFRDYGLVISDRALQLKEFLLHNLPDLRFCMIMEIFI